MSHFSHYLSVHLKMKSLCPLTWSILKFQLKCFTTLAFLHTDIASIDMWGIKTKTTSAICSGKEIPILCFKNRFITYFYFRSFWHFALVWNFLQIPTVIFIWVRWQQWALFFILHPWKVNCHFSSHSIEILGGLVNKTLEWIKNWNTF